MVARTLYAGFAVLAVVSIGAGTSRHSGVLPKVLAPAKDETSWSEDLAPLATPCPAGTLPDGDSCVRLPDESAGAPEVESESRIHRDRYGQWIAYDEIPRRPDRAEGYDAYRYPVPCRPGCIVSGYDLDQPDERQRRQRTRVGHGGVDLAAPRGTPVKVVALEHQQGDAQIVYVGPLFGTTIVTRQTVREGGSLRDYLVLFGHLDGTAAGIADHVGIYVREGDTIGFVGDSGSPGRVHLHLETRRVRDGVDASHLAPSAMVDGAVTVVCDPRNVLGVL